MATITSSRTFEAPPAVVWAVVTDPDVYASVAPNLSAVEILEGNGEGMVRRCVDTDGNAWTETVDAWEDGHRFAVSVDVADSEFHRRLFHRFEGEWRVAEGRDGTRVTMRFEYEPRYGPFGWLISKYFERRAPSLIAAIFDGWETAIQSRLDGVEASRESARTIDPVPGAAPVAETTEGTEESATDGD